MNKLNALVARYFPAAAIAAANVASLGSLGGLGRGAALGPAQDSYADGGPSAASLLGLQAETDRATLRALTASHLLAAGHRTSMSIINNIGK